jgi:hypothetical protein
MAFCWRTQHDPIELNKVWYPPGMITAENGP